MPGLLLDSNPRPEVVVPPKASVSGTHFLTNVYSMDISSQGCLSEVRSLLNSPSKIAAIRNLRGKEAQKFVDFLDLVLAQTHIEKKLWQQGLLLFSKVCKTSGIIPTSYVLRQEQIHVGCSYYGTGSRQVYNGVYLGSPVAIKHLPAIGLKTSEDSSEYFKRFCREVIGWKHLSHPNIMSLLGVSMSEELRCFQVLTKWMPNGNVMQYAEAHPSENRLKLLSGATCGVAYLHELSIVHGDLKGANILVDNAGIARVADFGLMTIVKRSTVISSETVSPGGTIFWMSPELLDPSSFGSKGRPTCESDSYALGMVVYELLTGLRPFHYECDYEAVGPILRGERPEKPLDAESLGFSCELWELVQSCWGRTARTRPTAQQLLDCLSAASQAWVPSRVYPIARADAHSTVGSDSSGISRAALHYDWA